ncbi:hypothetical protein [Halorussus caseinilyticus]|uniref:Uncharacterized protein n=1 Tax=Halorussus caseinilyticus TaxID=3034025 RepID=A0ABD5WNF7_9EURY|nr:hypothetical protein [Halorussus sp. DT72]
MNNNGDDDDWDQLDEDIVDDEQDDGNGEIGVGNQVDENRVDQQVIDTSALEDLLEDVATTDEFVAELNEEVIGMVSTARKRALTQNRDSIQPRDLPRINSEKDDEWDQRDGDSP